MITLSNKEAEHIRELLYRASIVIWQEAGGDGSLEDSLDAAERSLQQKIWAADEEEK